MRIDRIRAAIIIVGMSTGASLGFAMDSGDSEQNSIETNANRHKRMRMTFADDISQEPIKFDVRNAITHIIKQIDGKDAFVNKYENIFYGSNIDVPVAEIQQRDAVWSIIYALYSVKDELADEQFEQALTSLRAVYTHITENHQIVHEAWTKFLKGDPHYVEYSADTRIRIHPDRTDIPVDQKAVVYYGILMKAYTHARSQGCLVDYFKHAFVAQRNKDICLTLISEAQRNWLQAQNANEAVR